MTKGLWLSNLKDDPQEARNWAEAHPDIVKELSQLIEH
jgi:hypothetical protein